MENVVTVKCEPDLPEEDLLEEPECVLEEDPDSSPFVQVCITADPVSQHIPEGGEVVEDNNQIHDSTNCNSEHSSAPPNIEAVKPDIQDIKAEPGIEEEGDINPVEFTEVHIHSHKSVNCSCGKPIVRATSVPESLTKGRKKIFQCDLCQKVFKRRGHLKSHLLSHTGEKNFPCEVCGKYFSKKEHLNRHNIIHTGEKRYGCSLCNKQFGQRGTLTRHMLTHTGQKDFQCPTCNKQFVQRDHLNRHLVTHTGEKNFECPICFKQFSLRCNVKQHLICHTKEKKFKCSVCPKLFAFKSVLKKHELTHERGKEFKCPVCFKEFEVYNSLRRHEATHKEVILGTEILEAMMRKAVSSNVQDALVNDTNTKEIGDAGMSENVASPEGKTSTSSRDEEEEETEDKSEGAINDDEDITV